MITEGEKYISGVLRNIGFALLAPVGSSIFQCLVFKQNLFNGHFAISFLVSLIGFILIILGYNVIEENKK